MQKKCRWGILGTAVIAQKNWAAIRNSGNATVVAVASRDPERARSFISDRQRECPFPSEPEACSYEQLLAREDVDAVYLPLPTGLRREWVIRAAQAGKHVLCEKPCAVDAAALREMIDACRENNVQFMDGVMFMHSRRLDALREVLDDGESIGDLKRITTQFTFRASEDFLNNNIRMSSQLEPQGALGDLGWYCIRFALWTMGSQLPRQVSARLLTRQGHSDSPHGVPLEVSGELLFDSGVSAGFYCSFLTENQQLAHVSGTRGYLQLSDFVLPHYGNEASFHVVNDVFNVNGCQFNMEHSSRRRAVREYSNNQENSQETQLFRTFSALVLDGRRDESWPSISLKTQLVLDACLESACNDARLVEISP